MRQRAPSNLLSALEFRSAVMVRRAAAFARRAWKHRSIRCALVVATAYPQAWALDDDAALGRATLAIRDAEAGVREVATARTTRRPATPEERIAAGDLFLRNRDYARAINMFDQVVELHRQGRATASAHSDALRWLGEAYFRDDQLLSARRQYRRLAQLAESPPYDQHAGVALGRLVDVALLTDRLGGLDFVFDQMDRVSGGAAGGSLRYARGKAYFAKRDYSSSERALLSVPKESSFYHQANYLLGVIFTKQAMGEDAPEADSATAEQVPEASRRFARAVVQFQKVTQLPPDSDDHRHVVDLAWMALGRLFYETDNYRDAADAYSHVDRRSAEYPTMLFELAWVFVRQKEFKQAERALEALTIIAPESLEFADGSLLRADLMLRSKQFNGALRVYQSVRSRFEPIRSQVNTFLDSTQDPAVYYDRLVENRLGVETQTGLPGVVMEWVREESEDERVFALIDDVTRSRDLVKRSRQLADKMNAVLGSSTRAKAFPDMKLRLQHALGLVNQLALAWRDLALGLEDVDDSAFSGRLGQVRAERRSLMQRLGRLPVTPGDFTRREAAGQRQWGKLSQRLQQLTLEADKLQAVVNGLRLVLADSEKYGVGVSDEDRVRLQAEVEANELDLSVYRKRIQEFRDSIERGRVQIGFGDKRYVNDKRIRVQFESLFREELQLAAAGNGGGDSMNYARKALVLVGQSDKVRSDLHTISRGYLAELKDRSQDLLEILRTEERNVEAYADRIDALDQNARLLVGEVAKRNFGLVRERLRGIVLRADVGIVQQAWEVRQDHLDQVQQLQRERATEEQYLNDELKEVLEDGMGDQ